MSLGFLALIVLAVVVSISALAALLANRRTRPIGFTILAVPVVLAGLVAVRFYPQKNERSVRPASVNELKTVFQTRSETIDKPQKPEKPSQPKAEASLPDASQPPDDGETTKSIVRALTTAFTQTLAEFKSVPAHQAEVETQEEADTQEDESGIAEIAEIVDAEKINKMVEVISGAVRQELPEGVEVDQFTALRALGKLLGRVIVSEQQEEQAAVATNAKGQQPPADNTSAAGRPAWVDDGPRRVGDAYQIVVVAGPYTTRLECDQDMPEQLNRAVAEYAEVYLGDEKSRRVRLSPDFLREHVLKEQWEEMFQSSVGPMVRLHARVLFDGRTNSELKACLRRVIVEERLVLAGCGLAAVLVLLAGGFGVLKFDNTSGGRYRGRMLFALVFLAVAVIACVAVAVRFWLW